MRELANKIKNDKRLLTIIGTFMVAQCLYLFIGAIYNLHYGTSRGIVDLFGQWDVGWYSQIAINGYTSIEEVMMEEVQQRPWVFLPLYPMSVRIVNYMFPFFSVRLCGMIVSNICNLVATYYAILLAKEKRIDIDEKILAFFMILGPYTLYFNAMYTEAMFVMLIVLFFYHCERKKYLYAGICSAFASATRVVGVLLVFALLCKIISSEDGKIYVRIRSSVVKIFREPLLMLSVLLCPMGMFIYCLFLYYRVGDPLAFMHGQIGWGRNDRSIIESFFVALTGQEGIEKIYLAVLAIVAILLCLYLWCKKHYIEAALSLVMMYIPLRSSVGCAPRYAVGCFFPVLASAMLVGKIKKRTVQYLILILSIIWESVLVYCWYCGYMFMI